MSFSRHILLPLLLLFLLCPTAAAQEIPFIDAHSQMPKGLPPDTIVPLMDQAGVHITLLSARNDRQPGDVLKLAAQQPNRIIPMVRTKGMAFNLNKPNYYSLMETQLANSRFKGMAEILLYHAQKGDKAPEIAVYPDDPQAKFAIDACIQRGWPIIAHIEFAAAKAKKKAYMKRLKALLKAHPGHPVLLIHMGQLNADAARKLLAAHGNLHFMTSHANPVSINETNQPWTNLFKGRQLAPDWKRLMLDHPDRFVLTFDNVWPDHWGEFYLKQAELWREALGQLPPDAAHAIAHGNAERLWDLPPLR